MAVETEVSVEVAASVKEKTGLDVGSGQDLFKPDCSVIGHGDQADGSEDSRVFVNGTDGFGDDTVNNELNVVVLEGSCVESMPAVELQNGNFNVFNGSLKEGESGKIDSLAGAEVEMNGDQEGSFEGVAKTEQEKVENFTIGNANSATVETPETQVEALGLVIESVEKSELNDLLSDSESGSDNVDDECEDLNNIVSTETSGVCNGSSVSAFGNESQEEITEAQNEAPLATSMDSDLELNPINNKEILDEKEELNNLPSDKNADNATAECENQVNLGSSETFSPNLGSSDVVVDAVEFGLQEANTKGQNKANLEGEVNEHPELEVPVAISLDSGPESNAIDKEENLEQNGESENLLSCNNESNDASDESEGKIIVSSSEASGLCEGLSQVFVDAVKCEVPLAKSLDSDVELCPINTEGTFEKEAKTTVALDVMENLEQVDKVTSLVSSTDQHVETVDDLVSEEKNNAENTVQYSEEPEKNPDVTEASPVIMQSENDPEDSLPTHSVPVSQVQSHSEINMSGAETIEVVSSSPASVPKAQIIEKNTSLEPDSMLDTVVCSEKESTFQSGGIHVETEVSRCKGKVVHVSSATVKEKLAPAEAHTSFSVTYKKELLDRFGLNREAASNITWGTSKIRFGIANIEDMGDQSEGETVISDGNLTLKENKHTENSKNGGTSIASSTDEVCEEVPSNTSATKLVKYLVRVPRFDDESLKEQIKLQEILLDDWTKQRDAIKVLIQETRKANDQSHGVNYENAKNEVSNAQRLVRSKRVEIDSLQSMINKAKNAGSIQDIDRRISDMEHMIQHESMPLKEEKQLIHEIKQKKQLRKQLSSNMGSQDEIKESLEQKETLEERLKVLRKELDILKGKVVKAEVNAGEVERKYDDEYKKVKELHARHRAANDSRQVAYDQLKSLRIKLKEKNKPFYKYKDDAIAANNYACSKDREALHSQCKNQVEKFMQLWNNNDNFRKEYVTFNTKSTVRRFGTLDGRSLGPNEERHVIPSYDNQKVHKMVSTPAKVDSVSKSPVLELKQEINLENGISEEKTKKKSTKPKNKAAAAKHKEAAEPCSATVSGKDEPEQVQVEVEVEVEPTKSKEEIELERKVEEMRMKEDEAMLQEQHRLEEIAKAQEARERKKRKEEKEKRRAELKAQKEAEQKEKEREKRSRKKEKKKNGTTAVTAESSNSNDPGPSSETAIETAQDSEPPEEVSTSKKPKKRSAFAKQNKNRVNLPPPQIHKKRNWRKQHPWVMGISAIVLVLLACIVIKMLL